MKLICLPKYFRIVHFGMVVCFIFLFFVLAVQFFNSQVIQSFFTWTPFYVLFLSAFGSIEQILFQWLGWSPKLLTMQLDVEKIVLPPWKEEQVYYFKELTHRSVRIPRPKGGLRSFYRFYWLPRNGWLPVGKFSFKCGDDQHTLKFIIPSNDKLLEADQLFEKVFQQGRARP